MYLVTMWHTFYFCFIAPMAPEIIPDECTVTNNAIKLSWKPRKQSCVDGYVVEVDDGTSSGKEDNFLQVYRGDNLECTISGLQFNSTYRARVKGFNKAGEGAPSDEVYLTTSDSKQTILIYNNFISDLLFLSILLKSKFGECLLSSISKLPLT